MRHAFGETDLHVEGQALRAVIKGLERGTDILQCGRKREIGIFVVIVYAQIHSNGKCRVVCIFRINEIEVGTTRPSVGEQIAISGTDDHVLRVKVAKHVACHVRFVHRTVTHHLCSDRSGVAFAKSLNELCTVFGLRNFDVFKISSEMFSTRVCEQWGKIIFQNKKRSGFV